MQWKLKIQYKMRCIHHGVPLFLVHQLQQVCWSKQIDRSWRQIPNRKHTTTCVCCWTPTSALQSVWVHVLLCVTADIKSNGRVLVPIQIRALQTRPAACWGRWTTLSTKIVDWAARKTSWLSIWWHVRDHSWWSQWTLTTPGRKLSMRNQ